MTQIPSVHNPALSEIAYHDYLLLLVQMNSEWSRRCKQEDEFPPAENHVQFRKNSIFFGEGINAAYSAWHRANHQGANPTEGFLDGYLYNTMSYLPLEHADDACLVLLDDQSPAHHLTMRINRRIEDVSLAYCPRMGDLATTVVNRQKNPEQKASLKRIADTLFCEPHDVFDVRRGPRQTTHQEDIGKNVGQDRWVEHDIQSECPFLVFTEYRMDGIASVTQFLLAQQAIYKTMVTCILNAIDRLETLAGCCSTDYLDLRDITKTRCCLIDLQGAQEIGSMLFCNNLTVAMSIVAELRKLTYHDTFNEEPLFRSRLEGDETLQLVVRKATGKSDLQPESCVEKIELNHLFRWTTSSILVSPSMIAKDRPGSCSNKCNGKASGEIRVQIAAGHHELVRRDVTSKVEGLEEELDSQWYAFPVGEDDLIIPIVGKDRKDSITSRRWVSIGEVLRCWRECTVRGITECRTNERLYGTPFRGDRDWTWRSLFHTGRGTTMFQIGIQNCGRREPRTPTRFWWMF